MGQFRLQASNGQVDPGLLAWVQAAAANSPYDVVLYSGKREGDPRFHGKGMATDINLIDPKTGKAIPNYQSAEGFAAYQGFANNVRAAQMQMNPERANALRWGGYFSGGKGKYGALDLMHFDVGGETTPMGGGSWASGLTPEQAAIWGLTPGGGSTAVAGASVSPTLGDTLADAFAPEDPGKKLLSDMASGVSKSLLNKGNQGQVPLGSDLVGDLPTVSLETPSAVPASDTLETPGEMPSLPSPGGGLADLFKIKSIGSPPQLGRRF